MKARVTNALHVNGNRVYGGVVGIDFTAEWPTDPEGVLYVYVDEQYKTPELVDAIRRAIENASVTPTSHHRRGNPDDVVVRDG